MTGRVIAGRYNLQHAIGRGAMGVVWRARDQLLDRDVAIKEVVISDLIGEDERRNAYQRTLREARTAARLSHRGVVTIYDVVEEDARPWIVMELVPSQSLDQLLTVEGRLPTARAGRIGQQLLSALAAAHAAGVLHRDVKPSNVLIAAARSGDGWDERAVLTDFGIAQFEGDPRLTQTGMVMGSPGFTAPERIRGGAATPASDLWSLGATLFAAVEGRGPYEKRGGAITTMTAIINEDAPAAMAAGPLGPLIAALLHRNPRLRPPATAAGRMFAGVLPLLPPDPLPAQRRPKLALTALSGPSGADSTSPDGAPAPVAGTVPGTVPGALADPEDAPEEKVSAEKGSEEKTDDQQATMADGPASEDTDGNTVSPATASGGDAAEDSGSDDTVREVRDDPEKAEDGLPESTAGADTAADAEDPADEEAAAASSEDSPAPDETEDPAGEPEDRTGEPETADQPGTPDEADAPDEQDIPTVDAPTAEVLAKSRATAPEGTEDTAEDAEDADVSRDDDASGADDAEADQEAREVPSFRLAAALTEEPPTMVADGPPAITAAIASPTAVLSAVRPSAVKSPARKLPTPSPPARVSRPPAGVPSSDDAPTRPQPARYLPAAGYPPRASLARRRRGRRAVIAVTVLVILVVIGAAVALMTSHGLSTTGNTASASTTLPDAVKAVHSPASVTPAGWTRTGRLPGREDGLSGGERPVA